MGQTAAQALACRPRPKNFFVEVEGVCFSYCAQHRPVKFNTLLAKLVTDRLVEYLRRHPLMSRTVATGSEPRACTLCIPATSEVDDTMMRKPKAPNRQGLHTKLQLHAIGVASYGGGEKFSEPFLELI